MNGPVKLASLIGLVLVAGAAPAISVGADDRRATITLVDESPLVVSGTGFARREAVLVRASVSGQSFKRVVIASRLGKFTKRIAEVDASCSPFTVTATGRTGNRAVLRRINIPPPCGIVIQP